MKYIIKHRLGQLISSTEVNVADDMEDWDDWDIAVADAVIDDDGNPFRVGSEITITRIE